MEILTPTSKLTRRQAFEELRGLLRRRGGRVLHDESNRLTEYRFDLFSEYASNMEWALRDGGLSYWIDITMDEFLDQFVFADDSARRLKNERSDL